MERTASRDGARQAVPFAPMRTNRSVPEYWAGDDDRVDWQPAPMTGGKAAPVHAEGPRRRHGEPHDEAALSTVRQPSTSQHEPESGLRSVESVPSANRVS